MFERINKQLFYTLVILIILMGVGTVYYSAAEGWSYVDSFYFSTITLTTIGFGDLAPTLPETRIFTAVYALLGIGVMLYILSSVIGGFIFHQEKYFERLFSHDKKMKRRRKEIKKEDTVIKEQEKKIKKQEKQLKEQEKRIERIKKRIES